LTVEGAPELPSEGVALSLGLVSLVLEDDSPALGLAAASLPAAPEVVLPVAL
jgi:hypothetical protein